MIVRNNVEIYSICWLNHAKGGVIGTYYEPENKEELIRLCQKLYAEGKPFDIIGHTSNIYFLPSYSVDIMVSTRKVRNYVIGEDYIECDCGVSVRRLARRMVEEGIEGFDGLVDLPGTVASSVYNNASCFHCSINSLLLSFELLCPDGIINTLDLSDLNLSHRSSSLKRNELKGVIVGVRLKRRKGDVVNIRTLAKRWHEERLKTQPGPQDNLGDIYYGGKMTTIGVILCCLTKCYQKYLMYRGLEKDVMKRRIISLSLRCMGQKELIPYVYNWGRYIWKDEKSHRMFEKYCRLHSMLFKGCRFEIEIRG